MAKISTLYDDFNDNSLNTSKWDITGDVVEQNQRLEMYSTNASDAILDSVDDDYDLTGSQLQVKIEHSGLDADCDLNMFYWKSGESTYIRYQISANSTLYGKTRFQGGTVETVFSTSYDSDAHKWLRIREDNGTIYYETSSDGLTWVIRGTVASPGWITTGFYRLNFINNVADDAWVYFDNVNLPIANNFLLNDTIIKRPTNMRREPVYLKQDIDTLSGATFRDIVKQKEKIVLYYEHLNENEIGAIMDIVNLNTAVTFLASGGDFLISEINVHPYVKYREYEKGGSLYEKVELHLYQVS